MAYKFFCPMGQKDCFARLQTGGCGCLDAKALDEDKQCKFYKNKEQFKAENGGKPWKWKPN